MTKNKIQEHFCQYIYPKLYRTSESFIFVEILIFSDAMSHFIKSEVARLVLSYLHEFNLGKHQKLYKLQNVGSNRLNVLIGLRGSGWENESVFNAYRHRVSFICSFIFFLCFHMSAFYYLNTLWATLWSDGAGGVSTVADVAKIVAVIDLPDTLFPNVSVAVTVISCFVPAAPVAGAETVRLLIRPAVPWT